MHWLQRLWREDQAQATTEYILLLAVIVGLVVTLVKKLVQPVFKRLLQVLTSNIESKFFGGDLHTFRVHR